MVILSVGVCDKDGVLLLSRQFTQMGRTLVEDTYLSFPKLIKTGQQHTYVQSEKHLFIYSPLNSLYLVLVCSRNSNIIEHSETIRLLYKVICSICTETINEDTLDKNAVDLLLAFDDLISNGYRESISLQEIEAQCRMDSAQEKTHLALQKQQEQDAKVAAEKNMKK